SWWDETKGRHDLRLASLAGNAAPSRLYDNPDVTWLMPFDWSPDGKSVAVEIARIDHTNQLGLISVPDGSLKVLKSIEWRKAGRIAARLPGLLHRRGVVAGRKAARLCLEAWTARRQESCSRYPFERHRSGPGAAAEPELLHLDRLGARWTEASRVRTRLQGASR